MTREELDYCTATAFLGDGKKIDLGYPINKAKRGLVFEWTNNEMIPVMLMDIRVNGPRGQKFDKHIGRLVLPRQYVRFESMKETGCYEIVDQEAVCDSA